MLRLDFQRQSQFRPVVGVGGVEAMAVAVAVVVVFVVVVLLAVL